MPSGNVVIDLTDDSNVTIGITSATLTEDEVQSQVLAIGIDILSTGIYNGKGVASVTCESEIAAVMTDILVGSL